jgi:hypothetical protein
MEENLRKLFLDSRQTGEYFLVNYFHRFLVNPQPAPLAFCSNL